MINQNAVSRERIADAARTEIEEKGILGLRVQDVARKANVSVPLIYKYYGDRDGLLCEVLSRLFTETTRVQMERGATVIRAAGQNVTADDIVVALVTDDHEAMVRRRSQMVQILAAASEIPALGEYVRNAHAEIQKTYEGFLRQVFVELGVDEELPAASLATLINAATFGMALDDLLGDGAVDKAEFTQLIRVLVRAVMDKHTHPRA